MGGTGSAAASPVPARCEQCRAPAGGASDEV